MGKNTYNNLIDRKVILKIGGKLFFIKYQG